MAITLNSSAQANSNTVTMSSHATGDVLVVVAWSSSVITPPSGWGISASYWSTSASAWCIIGWKLAASGSETTVTWTNCTHIMVHVYRGASGVGASSFNQGNSTSMGYPALTRLSSSPWVMRIGFHAGASNVSSATLTGYTNRLAGNASFTSKDSNGSVGSDPTLDSVTVNASNVWMTGTIEIIDSTALPTGIWRIGGVSVATTSVTLGTHAAGDLLLAYAYRDGNNTAPTLPGGWTNLDSTGANTNSARVAYKWATSSSETSGTWTSATGLVILTYRGVAAIGGTAVGSGSATTLTYPALTLKLTNGTSVGVRFAGHRTATNITTNAPSTVPNNLITGVATEVTSYDESVSANITSGTQGVSANSGYRTATVELISQGGAATATLADTFSDATVDTALWDISTSGSGSVTESGGHVALDSGTTSGNFARLSSDNYYSLENSSYIFRLSGWPYWASSTIMFAGLMITDNYTNTSAYLGIRLTGTTTTAQAYVGSTFVGSSFTFNQGDWIRIRHASSTIYIDSQTVGDTSWTNRWSISDTDISVHGWRSTKGWFRANHDGIGQTIFYVDVVNPTYTGTIAATLQAPYIAAHSQYLPISSLADNFNDLSETDSPNPEIWLNDGNVPAGAYSSAAINTTFGASWSWGGMGILTYIPAAPALLYSVIGSISYFDFTNSSLMWEVPALHIDELDSVVANRFAVCGVGGDGAGAAFYFAYDTTAIFVSAGETSIEYDPVEHRWFRIREAAGTVYWETSADGTSWNSFDSVATSELFTTLGAEYPQFGMIAIGGADITNTQYMVIDNVNVQALRKAHTFSDNFNAGINTDRWTDSFADDSAKVTSVSGGVQLAYGTGPEYNEIRTNEYLNLIGSEVFVQVADFGNLSNNSQEIFLELMADDDNSLQIIVSASGDNITGGYEVGGSWTALSWISLNQTNHRWWRIRESGGTIYYDTAPDGLTWTNRWSVANPIDVSALQIRLAVGIYNTESSGASARFDNLNSRGLAKTLTLRDNFSSGINGSVWDELDDPADVYPSGGGVRMDHDNTATNYAYLQTSDFWDATESVCFVELIDAGNQSLDSHEAALILFAEGDSNNQIDFQAIDGMLGLFVNIDGVGTFEQLDTYNSTDHRWLRIREAGGLLYFDTAPDGTTWTNHHSMTTPFNLTAASIILLAGASQAEASGSYAIFDNFNTQDLPKAETLTDDFTGGTLDSGKWTDDAASGGSVTVVDNRLRLETEGAAYSWALIQSNDYYDLTDSAVYVQIPDPGNRPTGWAARIAIVTYPNSPDWARVYVSDQYGVVAQVNNADDLVYNEGTGTYDPAVHRWLRIRESGGTLYFAYSADGLDWVEPASTATANWSMTAVQILLEAQADQASSGQISYFDHFNTPWAGPVFRSAAELPIGAASANVNIPVPSGVAADDIMLAFIFLKNSGGAGIPSQTMSGVPSGFTQIGTPFDYAGTRDIRVFTYWKRATGADAGTYNFTLSSSHPEFSAYVARYSGCVTTGDPYDVWNANANDSDTTPSVSVTTAGSSRLLVHVNVSNAGYQIVSPANGYVLDASGPDDDTSHGWGILSREQDTAGASGSVTAGWHTSHYGVSVSGLFALRATAGSTGKQTEFLFLFE